MRTLYKNDRDSYHLEPPKYYRSIWVWLMLLHLLKCQFNKCINSVQMFHLPSGFYLVHGIYRSHCGAGEKGESFSSNKISAPTLSH